MITKTQLANRNKHLGGSDIPAILGLDPFRSAADIWYQKTGKVTTEQSTGVMDDGSIMELSTLAFAARELGKLNTKAPECVGLGGLIIDHPDAILKSDGSPVEAKSQQYQTNEKWGEPLTDQVPDRVVIQAQTHLLCCPDTEICFIPVYLVFRRFVMFRVQRSQIIIDAISEAANEFWEKNVKGDLMPSDSKPSLEVLKRIKHSPGKVVTISPEAAHIWIEAKEAYSAADKRKKEAEAQLRAVLGDAVVGEFTGGKVIVQTVNKKSFVMPSTTYTQLQLKD
jgi:putative phage-type endonuclease